MSLRLFARVWNAENIDPLDKLLLLHFADVANADLGYGTRAEVDVDFLVKFLNSTPGAIEDAIERLVDRRLVAVPRRNQEDFPTHVDVCSARFEPV